MAPVFIFDLDGTLADAEHRMHHIKGETKDWRAFFAACTEDTPILQTILTLRMLKDSGAAIHIWTGRSEEVRTETEIWLNGYAADWRELRMRPVGDYRPDHVLKGEWLSSLTPDQRLALVAVFEDRDQVVQMWRAAGIPCFQVAPGNF